MPWNVEVKVPMAERAAGGRLVLDAPAGLSLGLKGGGGNPVAALRTAVVGLTVSYEGRAVLTQVLSD